MSTTITRLPLAMAVAASALTGCVSYFTDAPAFQEVRVPPDHGVIYVMRPASQLGMLQSISARVDDERWFQLYPGSYGAFYVKPGKTKLRVGIDVWASAGIFGGGAMTMAVSSAEADAKSAEIEIDVPPGGAVYVEASFAGWKEPPEAELIAPSDAKPDIKDLHLAAGGRPRLSPGSTTAPRANAVKPVVQPARQAPSAREAVADLARAVDVVARACTPNPEIEGTCDATTDEAERAIAAARTATDRVRSSDLRLDAAKAFRAFSSMLEAVEADRSEGRPVTLSKLGALSKAMRELESAADEEKP
jgi:hypothetical protein